MEIHQKLADAINEAKRAGGIVTEEWVIKYNLGYD